MEHPLDLTWRHLEPTPELMEAVEDGVDRLEEVGAKLQRCRVVVEGPPRRRKHGGLFHVTVDLVVPGHTFVVRRAPQEHHEHEDGRVAIRDAFEAARRQLTDRIHRAQDQRRGRGPARGG